MKRSFLIIPFSVIINLMIINATLYILTPETYLEYGVAVCLNFSWLIIGIGLNFYSIERKEKFITKYHKFLRHYLVFSLSYFSVLAFAKINFDSQKQILILSVLLILLSIYRGLFFEFRKRYRREGGNYLRVVVLGEDKNLPFLEEIFSKPDYGYRYLGYFHGKLKNSGTDDKYLGTFQNAFDYILENEVDEIYCAISQFTVEELTDLRSFADNNLKKLKLIPDNKGFYTHSMEFEIFDNVPVLNIRKSPLDKNYAKYGKRIFDIVGSSLVIFFVLSWLMPLLYILNKMESNGPLFFKQQRHGFNKKTFWCYKFRSMAVNKEANMQMCTRNDLRITKVGKFIRKTSVDELPQFINVFLGDMSIIGPRPHMEFHTVQYQKNVDKYLVRHFAKPGITGLAQVRGYRGEIIRKSDIVNRIRMDIFYLEKWSFLLDLKIVYQTIYNCLQGEEKAY
ncbi:exopolysaccharide biosynthesis polyprenyl glycosylphosphotransferase [Antarcticibacterium sp. 1MA-6-2]|uniref:exopolysaccharide biosynthesis polyprenyl glycosylphosphotransferase n=1 Tax=Antarcticibacterium sp. 1MA-6-2 TaxID=2908210 RepID=UPI001F35FEF5|nr:exopolysaccharide biosynthesis polyprenyl glycosylphosphotransferase [Antarcticibacterium sp. 1MA-6-2]UJH91754.1 exopolysaccharide biosynthesis polyprenyl glycosylphosphotransferase [Antarcticibacterium sp. 1MA-6-2]